MTAAVLILFSFALPAEVADVDRPARLIYAETLAANCPGDEGKIMPVIAGVIANRVNTRGGDVRSVVFEKDQFSSSLNIYRSSRYADFLCPKDIRLWSRAIEARPAPGLSADAYHYFLFKHDPRWTKAPWARTAIRPGVEFS